jgi:hypothetical protein
MNRHTRGPWHLIMSDNATPHITHEGGDHTDIDDLSARVCIMPAEIMQSFNSLANARLISAAPELLHACQMMLVCMNLADWEGDPAAIAARYAIKKATGEPA